jgi:hypothetical protein
MAPEAVFSDALMPVQLIFDGKKGLRFLNFIMFSL